MGRQRSEERERHWRVLIARQEASKLSVAAFCREEDVSPYSFYSWRRRLKRRDQEDPASGQFVAVAIPTVTAEPCQVVLANGRRVVVPSQFDASSLREIIAVLESISSC